MCHLVAIKYLSLGSSRADRLLTFLLWVKKSGCNRSGFMLNCSHRKSTPVYSISRTWFHVLDFTYSVKFIDAPIDITTEITLAFEITLVFATSYKCPPVYSLQSNRGNENHSSCVAFVFLWLFCNSQRHGGRVGVSPLPHELPTEHAPSNIDPQ